MAALSLCVLVSGCRGLSPRHPAPSATEAPRFEPPAAAVPTTNFKPPVFAQESVTITERPLAESAFKPIVPDNVCPAPVDSRVDELNRRVAELEKALTESTAEAQQARRAAEEAAKKAAELEKNSTVKALPTPTVVSKPVSKPPRKAPVLNIPGVTVVAEGEQLRFRLSDKAVFMPGTSRMKPEAEEMFRKIVAEIRNVDPEASLEIEGHTDSLNTDPANPMQKHDLSSVKAVVVMEYFVKSLLWDNGCIRTSAHGASRPIGDNGTSEGRQANNRIEIIVLER